MALVVINGLRNRQVVILNFYFQQEEVGNMCCLSSRRIQAQLATSVPLSRFKSGAFALWERAKFSAVAQQSGRGLPQSKTLRAARNARSNAQRLGLLQPSGAF